MRSIDLGVSLLLLLPFLEYCINKGSSISLRTFKYSLIAFFAESDKNTTRTFSPFPRIENSSFDKSKSRSREQSSDKRSPVEKNNSRIALSRRVFEVLFFLFVILFLRGASSNLLSSLLDIKSRLRSLILARSIRSGDREVIPLFIRYLRNERRAIRW